ncbi:Hemolysin C [Pannonibacter phragmitetus]|uniref:Hemolysin C n=1 Tax=Pannonibacter phragmitetus TaxID=121719 RepID=A0A378ZPU5_9HYPH|nr:transporter associated domain-containing protein [Pannonibacter phragmitetus]SUA99262.1 Hemolysin C [Pannonibacter phragmitetus]
MTVSESGSIATPAASPASVPVQEDGADPRLSGPRKPGPLARLAGHLTRLRRSSASSLRENLQDELARELVEGGDTAFSPEERLLLGNILRLRELRVDDVMVPRADIEAVDDSVTLGRLMEVFRENGHSRMPVYHESLDDPRGMVHIKDLMAFIARLATPSEAGAAKDTDVSAKNSALDLTLIDLTLTLAETGLLRPLLFVPPSMPATDLMAKMQASRVQMALVIDEYGGTDGLVSLEDIVETVVGDIEDEHDEDEEAMLQPAGEGVWIADPRIPLEELSEQLGTDFNAGEMAEEVDTLGGLLFTLLGRVPVRGELIAPKEVTGYEFEVLDADPRRIKRLRVRKRRVEGRTGDQRRRTKRDEKTTGTEPPAT